MQLVLLNGIDADELAQAVDPRCRPVASCRRGSAPSRTWRGTTRRVHSTVRGVEGTRHLTGAYFDAHPAGLAYVFGECLCPVRVDCAHVVAAVLTAAGVTGDGASPPRPPRRPGRARCVPCWPWSSQVARPAAFRSASSSPCPCRGSTRGRPEAGSGPGWCGRAAAVGWRAACAGPGWIPRTPWRARTGQRTCGCCGSCTRCTRRRPAREATTNRMTTARSTSPRSTAAGSGRSWTRPRALGWRSCTRAGSGRCRDTAPPSSAWT
jgi:hypothetical protein